MRTLLLSALTMHAVLAADSCLDCHAKLEGNLAAPAQAFPNDIHARHGFGCADCHGGDKTTADRQQSMSKSRGFLGKIPRTGVPRMCARCHSDTNLIHKYKPQQRTDQFAQYQTSVHGKRLAAGDASVANCIDCHSVHDIREARNARSPVHPLKLPETCAKCHADSSRMSKYKLDTHQFEQYRDSVHWDALSKRGDLSAPSCASCHGNHGATPPQVSSVAAVCGTCHVLLEDLYKKSPHEPVFSATGGCTVCHDNHGIKKPTSEMLAGPKAMCVQCHDAASAGGVAAAKMAEQLGRLATALDRSDDILRKARESGMEVSEAQLRQIEARENLIKARVAVHAFQVAAVEKPAGDGLAIAAETYRAGEGALQEKERRRIGLGVSLITIVVTLAGLALAIRAIEKRPGMTPAGR